MFYETHDNWITGERNWFEKLVWYVIIFFVICMIFIGFMTCSKNEVPNSANTTIETEVSSNNELQTQNYETEMKTSTEEEISTSVKEHLV